MWLIGLILSLMLPLIAVIAVLLINKSRREKGPKWSVFRFLFAGVFLASFVMFLPVQIEIAGTTLFDVERAVVLSVFHAIQMLAAGGEFKLITENMTTCAASLQVWYQGWAAVLFAVTPVFSFGFVLSLFKNLSAHFLYGIAFFKDTYVFSELNERSLALARDIKKNSQSGERRRPVAIVFNDVFEDDKESTYELIDAAKQLGAICFKKDILAVNYRFHSPNKSIYFYTIGVNETENLNQTLKLIDLYRDRENTRIYVFSIKIESELLLAVVDKGQIKVHRINEVRSLVNRELYERGHVLFDTARVSEDGTKKISAIVVGMGNHGTEMVKALAWYGQMDGYSLEIHAFDRDPLAEEKFVALAPELMSPQFNGQNIPGEAQYRITIHPDTDVTTRTFAKAIEEITDATYVFVALGNDDVNINTAVALRTYFERMKIKPIIQAVVYNAQQKKALEGITNYRKQAYDIQFIGDTESSYTEKVIMESDLEGEALERHRKWGKEEEFWTYEYNYRSSVAAALHLRARIHCGIPGADKEEGALTAEEKAIIEPLEHRRWNAYMRADGYVFSQSTDSSSRNDLGKMHNDLVAFERLHEDEKRKDSKVGTK